MRRERCMRREIDGREGVRESKGETCVVSHETRTF